MTIDYEPSTPRPDPTGQFDELAKCAGRELRDNAPTGGAAAIAQSANQRRTRQMAIGGSAVAILLIATVALINRKDRTGIVAVVPTTTSAAVSTSATTAPVTTYSGVVINLKCDAINLNRHEHLADVIDGSDQFGGHDPNLQHDLGRCSGWRSRPASRRATDRIDRRKGVRDAHVSRLRHI